MDGLEIACRPACCLLLLVVFVLSSSPHPPALYRGMALSSRKRMLGGAPGTDENATRRRDEVNRWAGGVEVDWDKWNERESEERGLKRMQ
eukprot:767178-Hanusia_phi.AAC.10